MTKSPYIAFPWLYFLGLFGAHRFYLGYWRTALVMLVLTLTVYAAIISLVWTIVDVFRMRSLIDKSNPLLKKL